MENTNKEKDQDKNQVDATNAHDEDDTEIDATTKRRMRYALTDNGQIASFETLVIQKKEFGRDEDFFSLKLTDDCPKDVKIEEEVKLLISVNGKNEQYRAKFYNVRKADNGIWYLGLSVYDSSNYQVASVRLSKYEKRAMLKKGYLKLVEIEGGAK